MEFKFSPRVVSEIEMAAKQPLFSLIKNVSVTNVLLFMEKGLGITPEQADTKLQEYFDQGGELPSLFIDIMEALQSKGFLPRSFNLSQVREGLKQPEAPVAG